MNPIVDREREQQELRELLQGHAPQLALLYGRRRVGKTHLLTHVWPVEQTFYWTASATTSLQIANSWSAIFRYGLGSH
jgi:AAA+ ATPase superfamily predicted ATPase